MWELDLDSESENDRVLGNMVDLKFGRIKLLKYTSNSFFNFINQLLYSFHFDFYFDQFIQKWIVF